MSVEDERRAVTRKAAGGGLITIASLEVGALLWSLASIGCRNGILRVRDLVIYAVMSCAVIAQAAVVWVVVGRGEAANPAVRAVICLVVAVAVGLLAFVNFTSHGPWLIDAVAALSFSLFSMSVGILIASGIGRGYFALTRKSPSARRYEPRSHDCWGRNASPPHCENEVRMPPRSAPAVADVTSPFLTTAEAAELAPTLREHRAQLMARQHPGLTQGWVFSDDSGGLLRKNYLRLPLEHVVKRVGIEQRFTVHGFRRTFNNIARQVAGEIVTRSITGHVTQVMTEHYSHVGREEKLAAAGSVVRLVFAAKMGASGGSSGGEPDPSDPSVQR
jgi:hypothetical protein